MHEFSISFRAYSCGIRAFFVGRGDVSVRKSRPSFRPAISAVADCYKRADALVHSRNLPGDVRSFSQSYNPYVRRVDYALLFNQAERAAGNLAPYKPGRVSRAVCNDVEKLLAFRVSSKTQIGRERRAFRAFEIASAVIQNADGVSFANKSADKLFVILRDAGAQIHQRGALIRPSRIGIDFKIRSDFPLRGFFRREKLFRAREIICDFSGDY